MKKSKEKKKCSVCKRKKSIDDFYVDNSKKSGRRSECKKCNAYIRKGYLF